MPTRFVELRIERTAQRDADLKARAISGQQLANALVLLDDRWSCQEVASAFLLNDDTIRGWHKLFEQRGIEGLTSFDVGGSASFLSAVQEEALKAFVAITLPSADLLSGTRACCITLSRDCAIQGPPHPRAGVSRGRQAQKASCLLMFSSCAAIDDDSQVL